MERFARQTDHDLDLDHLVPDLPLCEVVQDLRNTDPTQEHVLGHADGTGPIRRHELGRQDQD